MRELENKVKRACIMSEGNKITAMDLGLALPNGNDTTPVLNLKTVRELAEKKAINRALTQTNNNMAQTALLLGVTRPTLYALVTKYNMSTEEKN